jgi:succinate dehydrogenase (ubiquinone) iron-sulfur subunit
MLAALASACARRARLPAGSLAAWVSTSAESAQAQAAAAATQTTGKPPLFKEFNIYRWNPDSPEDPKYTTYKVDINRSAPPAVPTHPGRPADAPADRISAWPPAAAAP